jgi:chemotaxis protein methyltransferase CheR
MPEMERKDIEEYAAKIVSHIGMAVDGHNIDLISQVLKSRIQTLQCNFAEYLERFHNPETRRMELRDLAVELTVPETYFFRYPEHFLVLKKVTLPKIIRLKADDKRISILSAGCVSGEEAYSVAATVREMPELRDGWQIAITGIDINPRLLDKARAAQYKGWSLRSMSKPDRELYFREEKGEYLLRDEFRKMVNFEELNLLDDNDSFWRDRKFDIIFFRNVMIYFTPASAKIVVDRLSWGLVPDGYLFLSPSETLRSFTKQFHLHHTRDAFYYQRRPDFDAACGMAKMGNDPIPEEKAPVSELELSSPIADSAERVAAIAENQLSRMAASAKSKTAVSPIPAADLIEATDFLRQERYDEALLSIPPASEDSDALLLQAIVLSNKGQLEQPLQR